MAQYADESNLTSPANDPAVMRAWGEGAFVAASSFVPAGMTEVVYNTRDEGLHFPDVARAHVR